MYVVYLGNEKVGSFYHVLSADAYAHSLETRLSRFKSTDKVTIKIE